MSVRALHPQSNRCTFMAPDLNRSLKTSRAAEISVIDLQNNYTQTRGRRGDPKDYSTAPLHQTTSPRNEIAQEVLKEDSPIQYHNIFRPTFTLPTTTRRHASPDTPSRRAATPHPRKATLPRSGSPKILQQPVLSFRAAGLGAGACCKWNREDHKHQLHLNWLDRS